MELYHKVRRIVPLLVFIIILTATVMDVTCNTNADVVAEIHRLLSEKRSDVTRLLKYVGMSDEELIADLPFRSDVSYTFFAPTDDAFRFLVPMDISDPYYDPDLRHGILLRHFVRQRITDEELGSLSSLTMADGQVLNLTHNDGITRINGANIAKDIIESNLISIHFVDRTFVTDDEIREAVFKHPVDSAWWSSGRVHSGGNHQPVPIMPTRGFNRISIEDDQVPTVANFALSAMAKKMGTSGLTLNRIKSAQSQTFYGPVYKLLLEVKTDQGNLKDCEVVVFHRPWLRHDDETRMILTDFNWHDDE